MSKYELYLNDINSMRFQIIGESISKLPKEAIFKIKNDK